MATPATATVAAKAPEARVSLPVSFAKALLSGQKASPEDVKKYQRLIHLAEQRAEYDAKNK